MKRLLNIKIIILITLLSISLNAQEFYFSTGLNLTNYAFKGTDNMPLKLRSKTGQFYEIGLRKNIIYTKPQYIILQYAVGLSLNNFNATGGDIINSYQWETTYIGINNKFEYVIIPASRRNIFELLVGTQFQIIHIISGQQKTNAVIFDLTKEPEFKGFWIQPGVLLDTKYYISDYLQLSIGYNYSIAFNASNSTEEKLKFKNQQICFGLHFNIK